MKSIQVSEDILPLGEFKTHASRILRRLKESKRPIVITQNGKPAGVLITPAEFDRLEERQRFLSAVQEGLADSENERVLSDQELGQELDKEFGPLEK